MITNRSISYRLSRSLILTAIVLWLGMVIYVMFEAYHELSEAFDFVLLENAVRLLPLAAEIAQNGALAALEVQVPDIGEFEEFTEGLDFAVLAADGSVIFHETSAILPDHLEPGFSFTQDSRTFVLMSDARDFGVAVFETAGLRAYTLQEILPAMILPLLIVVPLLAAIAYVLSKNALTPIQNFAAQIGSRDGRNLAPIEAKDTPQELDPVAEEVERLLARVRGALEAERSFSAEAAHELRTPIAGALAQVQLVQQSAPSTELEKVETSLRSLSNLAETLLQHSRLENGFAVSDSVIDVVEVLDYLLQEPYFASLENDRFDVDYPEELRLNVRMDGDACAIALRNLMTNALRYSPANSMIKIKIRGSRIEAINASPRIPAELLAQLGQKFTRGDSGVSGTGLGLAITRAVMEDIGGALELRSPAPGRPDGFSATLVFPEEHIK